MHKSFIIKKLTRKKGPVREMIKSLHGDPVKEFRKDTQELKDKIIEKATGVPAPDRKAEEERRKRRMRARRG